LATRMATRKLVEHITLDEATILVASTVARRPR